MAIKKPAKPAINDIWMVTREYDGLAGAGGVKDVSRQLAEALALSGHKVSVVLPRYGFMAATQAGFAPLALSFDVSMPYVGAERREVVRISARQGLVTVYLVDALRFGEKRDIYTYTAEDEAANPLHRQGSGHGDYFAMNVLLQKAAIELMLALGRQPDVIHCHDGHTALLPAMVREKEGFRTFFSQTGLVVTIHNAGIGYHQEVGDLPFAEAITGLPSRVIRANLLDGKFDPLLAAAPYAVLNTVSENYARELRATDDDVLTGMLGHRLLARGFRLEGVTNGINPADFDPAHPKPLGLAAAFSPAKGELAGKKKCRQWLLNAVSGRKLAGVSQEGILDPKRPGPLFTFVGRFTPQKGVDKLIEALQGLLPVEPNFQILLLGTGPREIEDALAQLARDPATGGRVCVLRGYDPRLANQIYAAGDFFLIPSRYEPCGLTDFIAQLFGALPIVHHVGGLVKVIHGETGLAYQEHSGAALMAAMRLAIELFSKQPRKIAAMQQQSIRLIEQTYTWDRVKEQYLTLYTEARALLAPA
jgi:starch synthase